MVGSIQSKFNEGLATGLLKHDIKQRQHALMQAILAQPLQAIHGVPTGEQFEHLVKQTRGRYVFDQTRHRLQRLFRSRINFAIELDGKAHGAQHADRVFAIARAGVTNHTHHAVLQIFNALVVINDIFGGGVVIQCVDREITTRGILRMGTKLVVTQNAAIFVGRLRFRGRGTKSRGFDDLLTKDNMD